MTRDLAYVMATRGRERNVLFVADRAAGPGRALAAGPRPSRHGTACAAAHEHLQRGDTRSRAEGFRGSARSRSPAWQMAPWEAVMAQVLAKDDPLGTALEQMKAAQDYATNIGHLITITEAFWWRDVVPQIDEAVRPRIGPRRVRAVHERPGAARVAAADP